MGRVIVPPAEHKTFTLELTVEETALAIGAATIAGNMQHSHADRMLRGQDMPGITDPAVRVRIANDAREHGKQYERLAKKLATARRYDHG